MSKILYKGGSLSSTYKLTSPEKVVVVKQVSRRLEREYGFVRFYSQLKKHIRLYSLYPELFPEVLNVDSDDSSVFLEMEWLEGYIDLKSYFVSQSPLINPSYIASLVFDGLSIVHSQCYRKIQGLSKLFYHEEICQKICDAQESSMDFNLFTHQDYFLLNGSKVLNTLSDPSFILNTLKGFTFMEMDIHGNPTLENIMYNPESRQIKFIDPYEESIVDNKVHDFSMVLQCSNSHYGILNDSSLEISGNSVTSNVMIPESLTLFNDSFLNLIDQQDLIHSLLFEAFQFVRMLPFKVKANKISHAKYFYVYACALIQKVL